LLQFEAQTGAHPVRTKFVTRFVKEHFAVPIYEFICQSCGHEFEQILSFSETRIPACPSCHSEQVIRRMGRPAIHFKGSGWYITDSKKSSESKTSANGSNGASEKSQASEKVESSEKKADAMPAATESTAASTAAPAKSTTD
jgi:putative FmdB family regulatory protein